MSGTSKQLPVLTGPSNASPNHCVIQGLERFFDAHL
jgi:hypothetical protein